MKKQRAADIRETAKVHNVSLMG